MIECLEKQQQQQQRFALQHQQQPQHNNYLPNQASFTSLRQDVVSLDQFARNDYQNGLISANQPVVQVNNPDPSVLVDLQLQGRASENLRQQQTGNDLIGYYFGSISRETAEWILKNHGNLQDGAYLLRSSGPNDDFVLSLMVVHDSRLNLRHLSGNNNLAHPNPTSGLIQEVLHYKIVETEDSFVALHGQVGDEKFATIDELIEKAQGVATKPRWPIHRQALESQILPPTYWGLTIDQIRLAILIKAKQWGFPLFSSLFQQANHASLIMDNSAISVLNSTATDVSPQNGNGVTTLNNETIRTLIYKSLHEFQPWFHGKISREEAERRIGETTQRDGRFLVRERDNYSYAMCICHKKTTKHYRIDVLPTGELAIQDGHKFTSLMALVSHYTLMSDGLWCALTEACPRPIQKSLSDPTRVVQQPPSNKSSFVQANNLYCVPPQTEPGYPNCNNVDPSMAHLQAKSAAVLAHSGPHPAKGSSNAGSRQNPSDTRQSNNSSMICPNQSAVSMSIKAPIKEWLQTINQKWSQLMLAKNQQTLNSFLFGSSNPLNNHCRHGNRRAHHHSHQHNHQHQHQHHSRTCNHRERKSKIKTGDQSSCYSCSNDQHSTKISAPATFSGSMNSGRNLQLDRTGALNDRMTLPACRYCTSSSVINQPKGVGIMPHLSGYCYNGQNATQTQLTQQNANPMKGRKLDQGGEMSRAILTCLPQNSGFTLDSQSFIGSPLFAVQGSQCVTTSQAACNQGARNGNSQSGSSAGEEGSNVREDRLISPAQSVASNLNNNPYNTDNIYGSQASTAIVNNCMPATSSSSSSDTRNVIQPKDNLLFYQQNARNIMQSSQPQSNNRSLRPQQSNVTPAMIAPANFETRNEQLARGGVQRAGPILCGQHAGPAYRYTNGLPDDSATKLCTHPRYISRASDDSHLQTSSTQLAGQAALSKFVQFQDGQCLRTHRDTRSIQMAYMMSRQYQANQFNGHAGTLVQTSQNCRDPSRATQARLALSNLSNLEAASNSATNNFKATNNVSKDQTSTELDLIDCENSVFEFKYDPKLIKSSSIETLCDGAGEGEDYMESPSNFKTNSDLLRSLQPYWMDSEPAKDSILSPVPVSIGQASCVQQLDSVLASGHHQQATECRDFLLAQLNENQSCGATGHDSLYSMKKTHDLDELTTSLLAELTTSLRAQVDLKNKRSGLSSASCGANHQAAPRQNDHEQLAQAYGSDGQANPSDLVNEFDTLRK